MRSKNLVPVQVIVPQNPMGSNHSVQKGAFEEALQSTIESSLRSRGTAPSHVFSALYHRTRHWSNEGAGPRVSPQNALLPPLEITDETLGRDLMLVTSSDGQTGSSPTTSSVTSIRTSSVPVGSKEPSGVTPFVMQSRGPPPLLLSMPQSRMSTPVTSDTSTHATNGNRFMRPRLPTMMPQGLQLEQFKQARAEQLKHFQQFQRWQLMHHQRQGQLALPQVPLFNPLMAQPVINRNIKSIASGSINGSNAGHSSDPATYDPHSPTSPMFRKGFCKGGKDIRLSMLQRDGTAMTPYPADYALVAMSVSPTCQQVPTSLGTFQPPDIPSEVMVVVAINLKCLPPQQHEMSNPLLAMCIGCGDGTLHSFSLLASHINLRTTLPSQPASNLLGLNPLQRHARNFVLRDVKLPHVCIRGAIIPWKTDGNGNFEIGPRVPSSLTSSQATPFPSMYASNQASQARGNLPTMVQYPSRANIPLNLQKQVNYKLGARNSLRPNQTSFHPRHPLNTIGTASGTHDLQNKAQPTTSGQSSIVIGSPISSPNSSPNSVRAPCDSSVQLPSSLVQQIGIPVLVVCWEWQRGQNDNKNVHISHSYKKCFEDCLMMIPEQTITPALSKEMCYIATVHYLSSLESFEFPTVSSLSSFFGRTRLALATTEHGQLPIIQALALARMAAINHPEKLGLVISQVSKAHAINKCVSKLTVNCPSYHLIAHISGEEIVDFCILVTGPASRMTLEHLLSKEEYDNSISRQLKNPECILRKLKNTLSSKTLDECITKLSSTRCHPLTVFRTSFTPPEFLPKPSSPSTSITSTNVLNRISDTHNNKTISTSTSPGFDVLSFPSSRKHNLTDNTLHRFHVQNYKSNRLLSPRLKSANHIADKLLSHVSTLSGDHNKLDLLRFTNVRCSFFVPPSPVCRSEVISDLKNSGMLQELGICSNSTNPSPREFFGLLFTTESKTKYRFNALREHINLNSATLFVLFHLDSHLHCDSSRSSDWITSLYGELVLNCCNVLLVSCSHIPQALLNQNTSIASENFLLCPRLEHKSANSYSLADHCLLLPQDMQDTMTFDPIHERESAALLKNLPDVHSSVVNARLLLRQYVAALASIIASHEIFSSGQSRIANNDGLRRLTTPTINSIVKDLMSSADGITILLRVPSESIAASFYSDLTEARNKLELQEAFEIMLYSSHTIPKLSEYFLETIRNFKKKPDDWIPETLSEIDCIPLLIIYTGQDLTTHQMPSTLKYIDLRLVTNNSDSYNQSFMLSELSLGHIESRVSSYRKILEPVSNVNDNEISEEPQQKKMKRDEQDSSPIDAMSTDGEQRSSNGEITNDVDSQSSSSQGDESPTYAENDKEETEEYQTISDELKRPQVILPKWMLSYAEGCLDKTNKFFDLPTHSNCDWISQARPILSDSITTDQMLEHISKWTYPTSKHPHYNSSADAGTQWIKPTVSPRHILLVSPPQAPVSLACCLFMKEMHRKLRKLLQVEVYNYKSSKKIQPCYPLPNSEQFPEWPNLTAVYKMNFVSMIDDPSVNLAKSQITNGIKSPKSMNDDNVPSTATCTTGKLCSFDLTHRSCSSCRMFERLQKPVAYELSVQNCGINLNTSSDNEMPLVVKFVIPESELDHFIFENLENNNHALECISLSQLNECGPKTPVFSLGLSGSKHGLYNLDHTLFQNIKVEPDSDALEIDEGTNKEPQPLHIIVIRSKDEYEYKIDWPNHIFMVLPESFDDLSMGSMKYAVQCVMQHCVEVMQNRMNVYDEEGNMEQVWPFALLLDDSAVVWTSCSSENVERMSPSSDIDPVEKRYSTEWKNISLLDVLKRIESIPIADQYAAIGIRPWASEMDIPICEEDMNYQVYSSAFSKCTLNTCIAINATLTKDVKYDFAKFMNEDIDWIARLVSADLPLFRFNDMAVAKKVIQSESNRETVLCVDDNLALVSLADSEFQPIPRHPRLLLELFFAKSGDIVFPKSKCNPNHPVLVIDHYMSLGSEVYVEFASSKLAAASWALNCEKSYSGLLLYCPSVALTQNFLQQFRFTPDSTVCIVERDRSSLRQIVVKLHLENDWHFRLTDEFQTTNEVGTQKPLYYLTGVLKSSSK